MNNLYKSSLSQPNEPIIKDVWADNLEEELRRISYLLDEYPYIGMVLISLVKFFRIQSFQE